MLRLLVLLAVLLLVFKLAGWLAIPWLAVLTPLWIIPAIVVALVLLALAGFGGLYVVCYVYDRPWLWLKRQWRKRRNRRDDRGNET